MIPGSANPLLLAGAAAEEAGYAISRSIRLNSGDSAFLSRTPSTAGNRKTWTWAGWVKRSAIINGHLFTCTSGTTDSTYLRLWIFNNQFYLGGYNTNFRASTAYYRDPSAWYHFVCAVDTTQATGANRIKMYVNGIQITSFALSSDPAQNADLGVNQNTAHRIAAETNTDGFFNGYLADIHFCDGYAYDPSYFTEFDDNGILQPIAFTGSYGTNGFHLDFSDNSSAAALGYDAAGSNDWTVNNISVASGAANDSLIDVPTNGTETDSGAGGEVRGNYCTLNPLDNGGLTLSNGNLDFNRTTASWISSRSTFGVSSGKWYWEVTLSTGVDCMVGISKNDAALSSYFANVVTGWAYNAQNGRKYNNGSGSDYGNSWVAGDTVGIAFDADAGSIYFYKNGTVQNSGTAAFTSLTSGPYFPSVALYGFTSTTAFINFGQRPFAYTAPSGYKALCTANLPAPTVENGSDYMDVALYTGNGSTQTISGLGFSPDLAWIKSRSGAYVHYLVDTVRGAQKRLSSDNTNAEAVNTQSLTAFNSDGFDLGNEQAVNENNKTYVAWTWDAGSSTVSNTDGSITSSVRANPTAGFSVVTWTVGTAPYTVGHGLNAEPYFIITKSRTGSGTNWSTYHKSTGNQSRTYLNLTLAASSGESVWNNTTPTSSVFSLGSSGEFSGDMVAYCFAPVESYSAFGSYTGNGSTDGPFVFTGFRPSFLITKETSGSGDWALWDAAREPNNVMDANLKPNSTEAESINSAHNLDMLSNGFKLRTTNLARNQSGASYVYIAFAENPFALNARAR